MSPFAYNGCWFAEDWQYSDATHAMFRVSRRQVPGVYLTRLVAVNRDLMTDSAIDWRDVVTRDLTAEPPQ